MPGIDAHGWNATTALATGSKVRTSRNAAHNVPRLGTHR